jgi:predicted aldo/keto reductase-like oxidoreductase
MSTKRDDGELDRREFLKTATAGAVGLGLTGMTARSLMADEGNKPADRVKTRELGKTGMKVSVVGYGCGGLNPQHLPLLQAAYANGITLFDTAWGYGRGQSEVAIGQFVETLKDRESIHIVTKASGWKPPAGSTKEVHAALKARLTESLRSLKSEYVDLFYWPHGASNTNYAKTCEEAVKDGFYDALMPVINICTQNPDKAGELRAHGRRRGRGRGIEDTRKMLIDAQRKEVGIIGMKVANGGYLGADTDELLAKAFPKESSLSRHQKLYTWMLEQKGIAAVVVGIREVKHLKEAIEVGKLA